ncbi:MAG: hypothetical protein A2942_00725 [Candidatus Lloydbacteria bacterium RIFCSPLOWO2_01_FULL_50_20]|uniref:Uncharacterized protein n=1 Tax=Candidatus Lloydbacteria bacterium RIFCSPLOWO2_01_FULL_50_20 TaxID=1798665 RepID=A0A1G2DDF3_9BACT|nr:MAG: hypothetical protein A3C13_04875 [Candidatus Lloydbacteria bacterium RIFCSPHIGHO2_02_FULL_50_11]OGZ11677.1 MAG: hypothetical protein A2942_00725 [Candidatus Lloydbacteria bacterium RIFCSPLOWO2_01_FULL_50_20]
MLFAFFVMFLATLFQEPTVLDGLRPAFLHGETGCFPDPLRISHIAKSKATAFRERNDRFHFSLLLFHDFYTFKTYTNG